MSSLKAVFFDLYGTLAGFDPPREVIQASAAEKFGLEVTTEGINAGYHLADEFMTHQNASKPVRSMNANEQWAFFARFEQLVLQGAGHEVDLELAGQIWVEIRRQEYSFALFPDVIPGLDRLRATGLTVAVISNMNSTSEQLCDDMGLTGHVDFAVTSGETGFEKPDPRIFEVALLKAGVTADQAILVGDQLQSDIYGAENAGMRPVLIDRYNGHPHYEKHPRVTDMESFLALVADITTPG
ncbi:MAG: HAD-IA family hydrolase [Dehalococcoidia bacterium]|nr:HAD-IA family hydrolase [Dehalococcoidia bacterium]